MSRTRFWGRTLGLGLAALLVMAAPALAIERWGKVESIDREFQKFALVQEGSEKKYTIRIGPDSVLAYQNGRVVPLVDVRQIENHRIFAIVEENVSHYANKVWIRPDVAPNQDPINPGVGAVLDDESQEP